MVSINQDEFLKVYKILFGKLTQSKTEALQFLLTKLTTSARIDSIPKKSYVLATVKWETADTFEPITEYGSAKYLQSKKYYPFIGRGYVQLTWKSNYKKFGDFLGIDLILNPQLANTPEVAWQILEIGMTDDFGIQDPDFTNYTLENFFNKHQKNYFGARMIINPKDHDSFLPISEMAQKFEQCFNRAYITPENIPPARG